MSGLDLLWLTSTQKEIEEEVLSEISIDTIFEHIKTLSKWVRDSGTEDAGKAYSYIKEKLEENGVPVRTFSIDAFLSHGGMAELKIQHPERKTLNALSHAFSGSTSNVGFEGELIDAEGMTEKDFAGMDLDGKILLDPEISYLVAEELGVKAFLQPHIIKHDVPHKSQVKEVWGPPTPENMNKLAQIPILSITKKVGKHLKGLCKQGQVRVWLRTKVRKYWGKINLPIAVIEGTEEPEKFVLVGAHYDGWWLGSTDNATGVAGMMELARALMRNRDKLKRSVRIAFWPGHSSGTYAGSTWYADNFWEDLRDNALIFIHHDGPGRKGAGFPLRARLHSEMKSFLLETVKEVTGKELLVRKWGRTGDQSFWGIGVPSFSTTETYSEEVVREVGRGDWWWHTPEDTLDKVDLGNVELHLKTDATILLRVCNCPVIPYEFVSVAEDFFGELSNLQKKVTGAFDLASLIGKVERLKTQSAELENTIKEILPKYKDLENSTREDTRALNRCLISLSRILMPVLYTNSGPFGHDPPARRIKFLPVLQKLDELAAMDPESDGYKSLGTQLIRERNKVSFALDQSLTILKDTLKTVKKLHSEK